MKKLKLTTLLVFASCGLNLTVSAQPNLNTALVSADTPAAIAWSTNGTRDLLLKEIPVFFENQTANFVHLPAQYKLAANRIKLSDQFVEVFSGVPDGSIVLSNAKKLFPTSAHRSYEKAVVVTEADGQSIYAAGLLHWHCGRNNGNSARPTKMYRCDRNPTFSVYSHGNTPVDAVTKDALVTWVKNILATRNSQKHAPPSFHTTEVAVSFTALK